MTWPTISELAAAKKAGKTITITIAGHRDGPRQISLAQLLEARRKVEASPPGTVFERAFQWWPQTREEIIEEFRRGTLDRIGQRCAVAQVQPTR